MPEETDPGWRERWAADAATFGQAPLPARFRDSPNAGLPLDWSQELAEDHSREVARAARARLVPRLLREARDRGWWIADATGSVARSASDGADMDAADAGNATPTILATVDAATWSGLTLAPRVIAPAHTGDAHALVAAALSDGVRVGAAVAGATVVGLAVTAPDDELLAIGVGPGLRDNGLATRLLAASGATHAAIHPLAERDPSEPLDLQARTAIWARLHERAGIRLVTAASGAQS